MTALWAMQPDMALFLITHYLNEIDLEERSNNAFRHTIAMLYELSATNPEALAHRIYESADAQLSNHGYDVLDLIKERWRQKRATFKETLMRMIVNQEEERTSSANVELFKNLRIRLQYATSTESINEVVSAIVSCDLFLEKTKKSLKEELLELMSYEKLEKIFILARTLHSQLNAGNVDQALNLIIKLDVEDLAIIMHWPHIASLISRLNNQELAAKLFEYACEHQSVDILAKLIAENIVGVKDVMDRISDPDTTEDEMAFYYLSLTLANTPDANIVVAENFEFFVDRIRNASKGFFSDLAQWLIIHHQMSATDEQKLNHARVIFSQLLRLSDRDSAKLIMLRRFAETLMQKGEGMKGEFKHAATPFMLLFEMFGEAAFVSPEHDLAGIDAQAVTFAHTRQVRTYLPLEAGQASTTISSPDNPPKPSPH